MAVVGALEEMKEVPVWIFDSRRPWKDQRPLVLPPHPDPERRLLVNSWSPDGTRLIGQDRLQRTGISMYSLDSRTYDHVVDFGEWPVWLPDSRRALFVADGNAFHVVDTRTKSVKKIYSVRRDVIGPPRLTRDGRTAVFSRRVTESDIWLATIKQ